MNTAPENARSAGMRETTRWRFHKSGNKWNPPEIVTGALEIDSRIVRCLEGDGNIAWTRTFHTRREAESCYQGDLRAMRKNDCYEWV